MKEYKFKVKVRKHALVLFFFVLFSIGVTYNESIQVIWIFGTIIVFFLAIIYLLKDGVYFKAYKYNDNNYSEIKGEFDFFDYRKFKDLNRPKL